jgi:broad specificity phosphatase PhoE
MGKLFLVRHAQTLYNLAQEQSEKAGIDHSSAEFRWDPVLADAELSCLGISQCQQARGLAHGLDIGKVFVSPLKRALQTCDLLFTDHPMHPEIIVHPVLHEVLHNGHDLSSYAGHPYPEYSHFNWSLVDSEVIFKQYLEQDYISLIQGLDHAQARTLLLSKMKEIAPNYLETETHLFNRAQYSKNIWKQEVSNIAIVTHSSFLKQFTKNNQTDPGRWLENCEIIEYILNN